MLQRYLQRHSSEGDSRLQFQNDTREAGNSGHQWNAVEVDEIIGEFYYDGIFLKRRIMKIVLKL